VLQVTAAHLSQTAGLPGKIMPVHGSPPAHSAGREQSWKDGQGAAAQAAAGRPSVATVAQQI